MKKVVVIVGPTCSGKTRLALEMKKELPIIDLINGDSVQVYKELNIGSDKISSSQQVDFPHQMLDVVSVNDIYSVYQYQEDVRQIISASNYPLIVGGSGFYIKSVISDYRFVKEQHDQNELDRILSLPLNSQIDFLKEKDPEIDILFTNERKRRRAIISVLNGVKPSSNKFEDEMKYDALIIYLDIPRDKLEPLIRSRIDAQLQNGFEKEVFSLRPYWGKLQDILGYREMIKYLNNEITIDDYRASLTRATMKLAKKQKTWFINKMNVTCLAALDENLISQTLTLIKAHFNL